MPVPRHQSVWRDISVVAADTVGHDALMAAIGEAPTPLVRSAQLYDIYRPSQPVAGIAAGERSLTLRLELRDDDNTLTDERSDAAVAQVRETLERRLGVRLRG